MGASDHGTHAAQVAEGHLPVGHSSRTNERRIVYFGYGSLVNRDTRPPDEQAFCARLRGWHRVWGHRSGPAVGRPPSCSLSVEPGVAGTRGIDGVLVSMPLEALPVLDAREAGYDRLTLPATEFDLPEGLGVDEIQVYRSKAEYRMPASPGQPILQSYVDCVLAGFLRVYGEGGLDDFLLSTRGWEGTIENDREAPRYPRAVELPGALRARFDRLVDARRGDGSTTAVVSGGGTKGH